MLLGRVSRGERSQDPENQLGPLRATAPKVGFDVADELRFTLSAWEKEEAALVWRKIVDAVTENRADVLMVWAVDRFCRGGPREMLNKINELEKHYGVHLYSYTEPFLSTATADPHVRELLLSLFAWLAEQESTRRSERLRAKADAKRNRAEALGERALWGKGKLPTRADYAAVLAGKAAGKTQRVVAAELGLSKSLVGRLWNTAAPPQTEGQKASSQEKPRPSGP